MADVLNVLKCGTTLQIKNKTWHRGSLARMSLHIDARHTYARMQARSYIRSRTHAHTNTLVWLRLTVNVKVYDPTPNYPLLSSDISRRTGPIAKTPLQNCNRVMKCRRNTRIMVIKPPKCGNLSR